MMWILMIAGVVLVLAGAVISLSASSEFVGLFGLLIAGSGCASFVAGGVVMSIRDADERLHSLLKKKHQEKVRPRSAE